MNCLIGACVFASLTCSSHEGSMIQIDAGGNHRSLGSIPLREGRAGVTPVEFDTSADRSCESASLMLGFDDFVTTHGRTYSIDSDEYKFRKDIFQKNMKVAAHHNCDSEKRFWTAGVTSLADRTDEELQRLRGYRRSTTTDTGHHTMEGPMVSMDRRAQTGLPESFAWINLTAAKEIVGQGACGSCWASATALMLRAHTNIYGTDREFAIQQLVSCVPNPEVCGGEGGCRGSTGELALDYVMHNGLETESNFQYMADDIDCPADKLAKHSNPIPQPSSSKSVNLSAFDLVESPAMTFGMVGWRRLPENKLEPLLQALYQEGPVAVAIVANWGWNWYLEGIMNSCTQSDMGVNHLVVLMGYGYDSDVDSKYWLLQNSWGNKWGEDGHMRMIRRDDKEEQAYCDWDTEPLKGVGCKGGPEKVWVCGSCGILMDSVVPQFQGSGPMAMEMLRRRNQTSF